MKNSMYLVAVISVVLVGCSSKPKEDIASAPTAPSGTSQSNWVFASPIFGEAITCLKRRGSSMDVLKDKAATLARAEIGRQAHDTVKAMIKIYREELDTVGGSSQQSTFEGIDRNVIDLSLVSSRLTQMAYVQDTRFMDDDVRFCVKVMIPPQEIAKAAKDAAANLTGGAMTPGMEDALRQKSKLRQEELGPIAPGAGL